MPIIIDADFSIDLCTLDDVRAHASYQAADHEQDEIIPKLITSLSRAILSIREFTPAREATTRLIEIHPRSGRRTFPIHPWDLQNLTSATVNADTNSARDLADGQWRLADYDHESQTYRAVELAEAPRAIDRFDRATLTLTGTWGFPSIPEDVVEACVLAVIMYLRRDVQAFGSALQPNSIGDDVNQAVALPPGVRGLLRRWEPVLVG